MSKKRFKRLTPSEQEEVDQILDYMCFAWKMVYVRGEATQEELQPQLDELEKRLRILGFYKTK